MAESARSLSARIDEPRAPLPSGVRRQERDEPTDVVADDLFDFDELGAAREESPASVDVAEILEDVAGAERARAEEEERAREPAAALPAEPREAPARPRGFTISWRSPLTWALAAVALLQVGLVGFTWKLSSSVRSRPDETPIESGGTEHGADAHDSDLEARDLEPREVRSLGVEPTGADALERARTEIESGDFAAARRRLYGLLATSDGFDEAARGDLVARARYLLADGLLEQAWSVSEDARPAEEQP